MEEQQLIRSLQNGSEAAFRQIVDRFQDKVLNTCLGMVPNRHDAEDITQEVFVEVYRSVAKFRGEAKLSTWIYRIAVTKSLEHIRKRSRKKRMAFFQSLIGLEDDRAKAVEDTFNHPGVQLENQQRSEILFAKINDLPENQRIAFVLHKVEGLSHKEVGEIMELSISAIESLLHRAKKNLRKTLFQYYQKKLI